MSRPKREPKGIEQWIQEAVARQADAVFLVPGEPPTYRTQGRITRGTGDPLTAVAVARLAASLIPAPRLSRLGPQTGVEQDLLQLPGEFSAVVNVARSAGDLAIVAFPVRTRPIEVGRLELPAAVVSAAEATHGLVLVTGPRGCGKTTTCFALLEHLNATREAHILVATYVLEYVLEPKRALITERRVGTDAPDMVTALASGLQQDTDVLYAGEIRDVETLGACLSAAETGHLVLTQLHQPTPAAAIRRVIDLHPPELRSAVRETLARTLRVVVTQRLLPRADGEGRIAAYGWLEPDHGVRALIATGDLGALDTLDSPRRRTWQDHARELARAGRTEAPAAPGDLPWGD